MSFYIGGIKTGVLNHSERSFVAVQDMQKEQEEKVTREKENEKKTSYRMVSDEETQEAKEDGEVKDARQVAIDIMEAEIEKVQKDIKVANEKMQALMQNNSPEAMIQLEMIQLEIEMLSEMLIGYTEALADLLDPERLED